MFIQPLITIGVGILALYVAGQMITARRARNLLQRQAAHERRVAKKRRDRMENMRGRIYNALVIAARENPAGRCVAHKFNDQDQLWVRVDQQQADGRYVCMLQVRVDLDGFEGFEIEINVCGYTWEYISCPEESVGREVLPRLVARTRTFGVK